MIKHYSLTTMIALGANILLTISPAAVLSWDFATGNDYVSVATDTDEVWELEINKYYGTIFTVGDNDGSSFQDTGNYVQIEYKWDANDWDDEAGTLYYLGRDELDDRWFLCDTYFQDGIWPWQCNEYNLFASFAFEPNQNNDWTGILKFQYRVKYTTYCVLTCSAWSEWADVYITVQPSSPPAPQDDDFTIERWEYLSYKEGCITPKFWPVDNDICSYNNDEGPCPSVEVSLGTPDENGNGDPITFLDTNEGGSVYLYASSNYAAKGPYYIDYFPPKDTDFAGTDCFAYFISEAGVTSEEEAIICITVEGEPPVAYDDEAFTTTGEPVAIQILGNDEFHDFDSLFISWTDVPDGDTVSNNGDGTVTYTPSEALVSGTRQFQYTIADDWGKSTGTVLVTIDYYFYRTSIDDTIYLSPGSTVVFDVGDNDYNPDGDKLQTRDAENDTNYVHCLQTRYTFDGTVVTLKAREEGDDLFEIGHTCQVHYYYDDYDSVEGTINIVMAEGT